MSTILSPKICDKASAAAMGVMATQTSGGTPYLTFKAAGTTYAMSIVDTKDIVEPSLRVPDFPLPAYIRGMMAVNGEIVPVVDIAARLGFAPARQTRQRSSVVIVEMAYLDESFSVGVIIDGVKEVLALYESDLMPPSSAQGQVRGDFIPSAQGQVRGDFIQALTRIHGHFVIAMHMEQVLSPQEVAELAGIGGHRELCCLH